MYIGSMNDGIEDKVSINFGANPFENMIPIGYTPWNNPNPVQSCIEKKSFSLLPLYYVLFWI